MHNYVAKEKIEKIYQIEPKIEGNSPLLAKFLAKSWCSNHFLFVTLIMQRSLVLSTSFVSAQQNNDFGLAVFDVNTTTAELTYDIGFSSDGKASCAFNHQDVNGSHDKAESLVWSENNQTFIAGGSAFEGNGVSNNGWNLEFCEFNLQGSLLPKSRYRKSQ